MRWLADENIPRSAIAYLRSRGEDATAIAELSPSIPDEAVIQVARTQDRILFRLRGRRTAFFYRSTATTAI
jgi:hypothetical protein